MAIINITSAQSPYNLTPEQISNLVNFPFQFIVGSGGGTIEVNLPSLNSLGYNGSIIAFCEDGSTTIQLNAYAGDIISINGGTTQSSLDVSGNNAFVGLDATNQGWLQSISAGGGAGQIVVLGTGAGSTLRCAANNTADSPASTVFGYCNNITVGHLFATISGGYCNAVCGTSTSGYDGFQTISGGGKNIIVTQGNGGLGETIGGGISNYINSNSNIGSTIGGGYKNCISCANNSTIAGGYYNNINSANGAVIGGGFRNTVNSNYGGILGGTNNCVIHDCSFIVGVNITTDAICTTYVNNLSIKAIPTSPSGLPSGSVWSDSGKLCIV